MDSKEDLQKLTIAQLKERLKQRRLPISGTKPDLVSRLFDSLQEDNLLAGTDANNDDLVDEDDLLGANVLNGDEELLLGLTPKAAKVAPKTAPTQKTETTPKKTAPKAVVKESAAGDATETKPAETTVPKREPIRPRISVGEESGGVEDAKKRRAERFGIAAVASVASANQKATPTAASDTSKHPISLNSSSKLLERAKRFGLPVGSEEKESTNGSSAPKILRITSTEEDSRKLARKQRFGE